MNRRDFLKLSIASGAALPLSQRGFAHTEGSPVAFRKLILSAPLTHSDWMLKAGIAWGPEGVHHMLDMCKECGWSRIYWRVLDGGRALYKSNLLRPMGKWDADSFWNPQTEEDKALHRRFTASMSDEQRRAILAKFDRLDYSQFDPFAEAIRYGHKIGMQIHAWVSINEDDHGWGLQSEFSKHHPEFRWQRRNGQRYRSQLSFAFPEVREYKLAILRELMANYDLDGLFVDWIRTGDVRDNPQNDADGVADYGYEQLPPGGETSPPPNSDETWVRERAKPQTHFMREVRKLVREHRRPLHIAALVGHPWHYRGEQDKIDGNLRGLLLDVRSWAREGLVDAVVPAGYYLNSGNAESAALALREETDGKVDVWTYAWVPTTIADLENTFAVADKTGTAQILFWEGDYIDDRPNAAELKSRMRSRAAWKEVEG
ncbi:family 10 glycosylhydrolase [Verrucomicrobiota bacterium sgz303538]